SSSGGKPAGGTDPRTSDRPDSRSRPSRPPQGSPRRAAPVTRGTPPRSDAPTTFTDGLGDIDVAVLPKAVRRDLEVLAPDTRARVERWLAASIIEMEEDPQQAYAYAKEAGRIGGRSAVVREAVGVAAYQAGEYKAARAELQAARRMAGRPELIPLLADCERALGNAAKALEIGSSQEAKVLRGEVQAELVLVLASARLDLGQPGAAVALLRGPCAQTPATAPWVSRIYYGYAEALLADGRPDEARSWFARAGAADPDGETDAELRAEEVDDPASTAQRRARDAEQDDDVAFLPDSD
ncbi:MAG: tetratricopeptide repeat protein, partial [Actinomycetes bacterium]